MLRFTQFSAGVMHNAVHDVTQGQILGHVRKVMVNAIIKLDVVAVRQADLHNDQPMMNRQMFITAAEHFMTECQLCAHANAAHQSRAADKQLA